MQYPTQIKLKLNFLCKFLLLNSILNTKIVKIDPVTFYERRKTIIFGISG